MAPIKLEPTMESLPLEVAASPLTAVAVGLMDGAELEEADGKSLGEMEGFNEGLLLGA